ncbi:hypothetical protein CHGG_08585 [Chaetomium globosum CBS 148.51]|uniref:Uncharacterized protein n=1 Tax=Chaetomium globosum (strain ATCC 6205 / CBS 148.51 / DSM 1962 / NBRC 6347 / NRRL 1970) TaxID=306901 RepID=Q2GTW9_CHAGB|nr:uncharacterized protein CHGG_08585 [Chaetomium globosum CBS 148.51]EAQ84571.1 hypothetical protein CHGG_08585 [Chaetomium globosum CBS 148.51]
MARRRLIIFAQVAVLSFASLYVLCHIHFSAWPLTRVESVDLGSYPVSPDAKLTRENLTAHIQAILDPNLNPDLPKLKCPPFNASRYEHLKINPSSSTTSSSDPPIHYFFALNLRNCLPILPRLLSSILEAIRFLGPSHCALSIVEGNSPDGTRRAPRRPRTHAHHSLHPHLLHPPHPRPTPSPPAPTASPPSPTCATSPWPPSPPTPRPSSASSTTWLSALTTSSSSSTKNTTIHTT